MLADGSGEDQKEEAREVATGTVDGGTRHEGGTVIWGVAGSWPHMRKVPPTPWVGGGGAWQQDAAPRDLTSCVSPCTPTVPRPHFDRSPGHENS